MILEVIDRRSAASDPTGCWVDAAAPPDSLTEAVAQLGRPDWTVNLVLADDGEVAGLNRTYREGDGVTDVLSFSYLAEDGDGAPDLAAGRSGAHHDLWRDAGGDAVGEVVLAADFVADRCRREGWRVEDEFALLVVHGCLHVLGWDHEDAAMGRDMRKLEAGLLEGMGLKHPLA